jgi:hypothetical protein
MSAPNQSVRLIWKCSSAYYGYMSVPVFIFLLQDDIMLPDRILRQYEAAKENTNAVSTQLVIHFSYSSFIQMCIWDYS